MFGHDDDKPEETAAATTDATTDTGSDAGTVVAPADETPATDTPTPADDTTPAPAASDDSASAPLVGSSDTPETPAADEGQTPADIVEPTASDSVSDIPPLTSNMSVPVDDASLLGLKKEALEELIPLVDQLDQSPEEKFKTTMMMIQATDTSNLIRVAHDAAKDIPDEKVRAQALLDIVNEINYFTQAQKSAES